MNRRNFFKTTTLGLGVAMLAPTIALGVTAEVPLYKQFDWLTHPASLMFRINSHQGKLSLVCMPVIAKTWKLKVISDVDVDLTQQKFTDEVSFDYMVDKFGNHIKRQRVSSGGCHPQTYYTNELLLNEAKKTGITHLYGFVRSTSIIDPYGRKYVCYGVRGVKRPDWKTVDGKLQVVEVDKDGDLIYPKKYGY
jgi:hypothetical protein